MMLLALHGFVLHTQCIHAHTLLKSCCLRPFTGFIHLSSTHPPLPHPHTQVNGLCHEMDFFFKYKHSNQYFFVCVDGFKIFQKFFTTLYNY